MKQRDETDCGAACLATVCQQYGAKQPLGRVRAIAGTDKLGTSAFGLVKAAEQLGFSARGVRGTMEALMQAQSLPLPAIAHVITDEGMLHYVVIQRVKNGVITVADPGKGIQKLTAEEFEKHWTGVLIILAPSVDGILQGPGEESTVRRFLGLLKGQGKFIALMTVASVLITVIGIVSAFYFKVIIDDIVPGKLWRTLTTMSLAILGLYIVNGLMNAARYQLVLHLQQRIDIPLVLGYYNHVVGLPMSFYGTRRTGEIITRFSDASRIQSALTGATVTVFVDVVMSIAGCVILAMQDKMLFLIAAIVALSNVALGLIVLRPLRLLNMELMESNAVVTSHFVESISAAETVKSYNAQSIVKNKADSLYVNFLRVVFRFGQWQNWQSVISSSVRSIGSAAVLWVGAVRILEGNLTIGGLVVFTSLLNYFLDPVQRLMGLQPDLQAAAVAARRLSDVLVLDQEELSADTQVDLKRIDQDIVLENVDFRYGTRQKVLEQVSLVIPAGATVGLVGESGSGKTTISKLLMKFYTPESGRIRFGNMVVEDISAESLRDRIAYVAQDTGFFSGSIEENLKLAKPDATAEEMIQACQIAQAHDFIAAMPARYQSYLEEGAANLSGGQRQRLAIARALLRGADMLILDEATSNMDSLSERAVSDTIHQLGRGVTSLVIAHRLSTVVACDIIYVLKAGRVVESGSHADLLAAGGAYASLWRAQSPLVDAAVAPKPTTTSAIAAGLVNAAPAGVGVANSGVAGPGVATAMPAGVGVAPGRPVPTGGVPTGAVPTGAVPTGAVPYNALPPANAALAPVVASTSVPQAGSAAQPAPSARAPRPTGSDQATARSARGQSTSPRASSAATSAATPGGSVRAAASAPPRTRGAGPESAQASASAANQTMNQTPARTRGAAAESAPTASTAKQVPDRTRDSAPAASQPGVTQPVTAPAPAPRGASSAVQAALAPVDAALAALREPIAVQDAPAAEIASSGRPDFLPAGSGIRVETVPAQTAPAQTAPPQTVAAQIAAQTSAAQTQPAVAAPTYQVDAPEAVGQADAGHHEAPDDSRQTAPRPESAFRPAPRAGAPVWAAQPAIASFRHPTPQSSGWPVPPSTAPTRGSGRDASRDAHRDPGAPVSQQRPAEPGWAAEPTRSQTPAGGPRPEPRVQPSVETVRTDAPSHPVVLRPYASDDANTAWPTPAFRKVDPPDDLAERLARLGVA